jgi:hypothetical protein
MSRQPDQKPKNSVSISSYRFKMDLVRTIDEVINDIKQSVDIDVDGNDEICEVKIDDRALKKSKTDI